MYSTIRFDFDSPREKGFVDLYDVLEQAGQHVANEAFGRLIWKANGTKSIEVGYLTLEQAQEFHTALYDQGSAKLHLPFTFVRNDDSLLHGGLLVEVERDPLNGTYRLRYLGVHT
jgi:hypothetical protein